MLQCPGDVLLPNEKPTLKPLWVVVPVKVVCKTPSDETRFVQRSRGLQSRLSRRNSEQPKRHRALAFIRLDKGRKRNTLFD